MRANEFIVKENILDKIGDAAHKSVIAGTARDKAKVRKKNVPGITKALHQILVSQASKTPEIKLEKMIINTLSKALKVDINQHKETFGNSVDRVVSAFGGSPESIRTDRMSDLIQTVVQNSFKVSDADTEFSMDELIEKVATDVDRGADLNKTLISALKQVGFADADIDPLIKKLDIEITQTPDEREAMKKVLTNATRSNASQTGDDQGEAGDDTKDEKADTKQTVDSIIETAVDEVLGDPELDTGDKEADKKNGTKRITGVFNKLGFTLGHPKFKEARDELVASRRMPWNGGFRGKVIAPSNTKGDVYVSDGKNVTQWKILKNDTWEYVGDIRDEGEIASLKALVLNKEATTYGRDFEKIEDKTYRVREID